MASSTAAISSSSATPPSASIGRPLAARRIPTATFSRSNGSRSPDRLTTTSGVSSTRSKVVNRRPQSMQARRRRIDEPSSAWRESTTLSSKEPQPGHRTPGTLLLRPRPAGAPAARATPEQAISPAAARAPGPRRAGELPLMATSWSTVTRTSVSGATASAIVHSVSPGCTTTVAGAATPAALEAAAEVGVGSPAAEEGAPPAILAVAELARRKMAVSTASVTTAATRRRRRYRACCASRAGARPPSSTRSVGRGGWPGPGRDGGGLEGDGGHVEKSPQGV